MKLTFFAGILRGKVAETHANWNLFKFGSNKYRSLESYPVPDERRKPTTYTPCDCAVTRGKTPVSLDSAGILRGDFRAGVWV